MILGVGVDIVEIARIQRAMRRRRFVERVLTATERSRDLTPTYVAGRWAAKEAVAKAVGTGLGWQKVEVLPGLNGRPCASVALPPGQSVQISIAHERGHAVAVAVLEG